MSHRTARRVREAEPISNARSLCGVGIYLVCIELACIELVAAAAEQGHNCIPSSERRGMAARTLGGIMRTSLCALAVATSLSLVLPAMADTIKSPLVGLWKLDSVTDIDSANARSSPMGDHPVGYSLYAKDGTFMLVQTASGRMAPAGAVPSDAEAGKLLATMVAVAGTYKMAGKDKYLIREDAVWNQLNVGAELPRGFKVSGKKLTVTLTVKNAAGQDVRRSVVYMRLE
jgi:hypothetical protein